MNHSDSLSLAGNLHLQKSFPNRNVSPPMPTKTNGKSPKAIKNRTLGAVSEPKLSLHFNSSHHVYRIYGILSSFWLEKSHGLWKLGGSTLCVSRLVMWFSAKFYLQTKTLIFNVLLFFEATNLCREICGNLRRVWMPQTRIDLRFQAQNQWCVNP